MQDMVRTAVVAAVADSQYILSASTTQMTEWSRRLSMQMGHGSCEDRLKRIEQKCMLCLAPRIAATNSSTFFRRPLDHEIGQLARRLYTDARQAAELLRQPV